nr:hypothetical protein [Tanacetum cinerariifolium]
KTSTKTRRIGIRIPQSNIPSSAADEAITKEMHDGLGRATTTSSSLAAEQGSDNDETLAETLLNIKRSAAKDKGNAIMQESKSPKKIKKKEMMQISFDEEIAQRFYEEEQAQILRDEEYAQQVQAQWITDEARLAQENLAQAKQWDDEQKVEEEIAQKGDVIAKQAEKESSKKAGGRLKRKTSKAREDKDKR